MEEKKITIRMLARETGIKENTLTQQSFYKRMMSLDDAYKISKVLGVSLEYLMTGENKGSVGITAREVPINVKQEIIADYLEEQIKRIEIIKAALLRDNEGENKGNIP